MATKRMLIDASHPEETRVVVVSGNRVEDFDVEVESRRQLKGNIYLAKVTRVEPSLQAAFVEYGGNRHGFLAFNEIHPDYYQIPVADREALLAEEESAQRAAGEAEEAEAAGDDEEHIEELGGAEDDMDEAEKARRPVVDRRRYKIQEVIKRRQILLVQVVKEERGNKGAALTTYLSLAGRYCVLMPNTARGGGVSRKIAAGQDRKRLKSVLAELGIPDGMAVIVRTAGAKRTKAEIKRDYEYLIRLWEQIRQKTLESIAPSLIHEEGNLIKRSIRDIYAKDLEEVIVSGDEGYRAAKDFMKLMMPSHAKRVQPYKDTGIPLLQRFQVEAQIDSMHSPEVHLKSGGYIVINSTEALVAIDVNSGRSTRERNIEETALKTNLEAADEIARQLRLRDLAGLIVIDFIDMENHRNQGKVERAMKDAMRNDRARIQIGRISPFGLLEMSRQRLRPSLQEMHSEPCPHCSGTGIRRSVDTTALQMLRIIEEEATKRRSSEITVHVPTEVALYIFNYKRDQLARVEAENEIKVYLEHDDSLIPPDYRMERIKIEGREETREEEPESPSQQASAGEGDEGGRKRRRRRRGRRGRRNEEGSEGQVSASDAANDDDDDEDDEEFEASEVNDDAEAPESVDDDVDEGEDAPEHAADDGEEQPKRRRRRRGRRAGRRRNRDAQADDAGAEGSTESADDEGESDAEGDATPAEPLLIAANEPMAALPAPESDKTSEAVAEVPEEVSEDAAPVAAEAAPESQQESEETADAGPVEMTATDTDADSVEEAEEPVALAADTARTTVIDVSQMPEEEKPARRGWWRRS